MILVTETTYPVDCTYIMNHTAYHSNKQENPGVKDWQRKIHVLGLVRQTFPEEQKKVMPEKKERGNHPCGSYHARES
jgi:hypothetical protein